MWYRQVKRFLRSHSRLAGSIIQPIFWMVFLGVGFTSALHGITVFRGLDYLNFFVPGVIVMAVFFTAFFSGISVIWDRELGFLKEILVAPASRVTIIMGRILGDSTVAFVQGLIVLIIAYILVPTLNPTGIPLTLLAAFFTALQFTGLGVAIACKLHSLEGFHLINMLAAMPIFFLSGAFYPINALPEWSIPIILMNPLVYGVDIARMALTGVNFLSPTTSITALIASALILSGIAGWLFKRATIE
jgi:ABC-2 type transport system permease protein